MIQVLGVHISEDFTTSTHTSTVSKKAWRSMYIFWRLRKFKICTALQKYFFSIRSVLSEE